MKRLLVFCLMILVTEVPAMFAGGPAEQSSKALAQQASLKEKAELFGPGTQVTARIRGTSSNVDYHGTIDEISGNNMKLKLKDRIMPIEFGQLEACISEQIAMRASAGRTRFRHAGSRSRSGSGKRQKGGASQSASVA